MSTRSTLLLALAALIVGLVAGGFVTSRYYQGQMKQIVGLISTTPMENAVSSSCRTLQTLRDGRTNEAIELQEINLDGNLHALEAMLKEDSGRNTNSTLLRARAYRAIFPREPVTADAKEKSQ